MPRPDGLIDHNNRLGVRFVVKQALGQLNPKMDKFVIFGQIEQKMSVTDRRESVSVQPSQQKPNFSGTNLPDPNIVHKGRFELRGRLVGHRLVLNQRLIRIIKRSRLGNVKVELNAPLVHIPRLAPNEPNSAIPLRGVRKRVESGQFVVDNALQKHFCGENHPLLLKQISLVLEHLGLVLVHRVGRLGPLRLQNEEFQKILV